MNIMVFDVAAEGGGALSVLIDYYNEFCKDKQNTYIFVLSKPILEQNSNVKILNLPWIKQSWFHRLFFDVFTAKSLVKHYEIDKVVSLQNIIIPFLNVPQTVLVHNALPFSEYKIRFRDSPKLCFYQNIIGFLIRQSCKSADCIIVQNNWMKKKVIEQIKIDGERIIVKPPIIEIQNVGKFLDTPESRKTFFYPAGAGIYKNHKVIVEACKKLKNENIGNYEIVFTLNGNENYNISKIKRTIDNENLPIHFIGVLPKDKVFDFYRKSILLFPSNIETIGLPLLEARSFNTPIIVADCDYAHEVLDHYENLFFFNPSDAEHLSRLICSYSQMKWAIW